MASNRCATSVLLDVSKSCSEGSKWDISFFERSLECVRKMLVKKFFSGGYDLLSLTLFGSNKTSNPLAEDCFYQNIEEVFRLLSPTWDEYAQLNDVKASSETSSNFLEALTVALNSLKRDIEPFKKKVKTRQIVVFSNFAGECDYDEDVLGDIIKSISDMKVEVIVIGLDIENELEGKESQAELPGNMAILAKIFKDLEDFISFTFEEALNSLLYFDKPKKEARALNIDFLIGSKIRIPVKWIKMTTEPHRFNWHHRTRGLESSSAPSTSKMFASSKPSTITISDEVMDDVDPAIEVKYMTDVQRKVRFGSSEVILTAADYDEMKRDTASPCFQYLGCTKRKKIHREMLVSEKIYLVLPNDGCPKSQPVFAGLVDALIEMDHVALCRRILTKAGKVLLGVLLPVSDESGKAFYFHQLPRREWTLDLPHDDEIYSELDKNDHIFQEIHEAVGEHIKSRMLPDDVFGEGNGILVRDPYFQHQCQLITMRALNKLDCNDLDYSVADHILKILNPLSLSPSDDDISSRMLEKLVIDEKEEEMKVQLERIKANREFFSEEGKDYIIESNLIIPENVLLEALGRKQAESIKEMALDPIQESIDEATLFDFSA